MEANDTPVVALATVYTLYYAAAVVLPLFNYFAMDYLDDQLGSSVAIWLVFFQLLGVDILLLVVDCVRHFTCAPRADRAESYELLEATTSMLSPGEVSWIGSAGFWHKVKWISGVAFLFSMNIILGNVGLNATGPLIHILLRAGVIIIIVLLALLTRSEWPTLLGTVCCFAVFCGVFLVSMEALNSKSSANAAGIAVNVVSVVFEGLQLVALRRVCVHLQRERLPSMSVSEITLIKMCIGTLFVFAAALIFERDDVDKVKDANGKCWLYVLFGVGITMLYQSTVVGLASFTKAVSLGMASQTKILPQVVLCVAFPTAFNSFSASGEYSLELWIGTGIIVVFFIIYGYDRYRVQAKAALSTRPFERLSTMTSSRVPPFSRFAGHR